MNNMRIEYDRKANAAYVYIKDKIAAGEVKKTISMNNEIILDFSEKMQLLGVEILNARKYLPKQAKLETVSKMV